MIELNEAAAMLADLIEGHGMEDWGLHVVKLQPPDGVLVADGKGRTWQVMAIRQRGPQ